MARGTMRTGATSRPSVGSSKKLSGSNEIKPFRDNESADPYYDPKWDNPYQRESTPSNEDPKRKADRERQQRIDEKDWDSLTKKKKQEDFNLDLTGSVGFSHEIVDLGGSSISFTAGVDFLPGPDLKIKDGKATVGVGVGLSRIHSVSGGLVIDLETKEVTGISGGLAAFGLGIEFSAEKCHTTVTITIGGIGISYGQDTCKKQEDEEEGKEPGEPVPEPIELEPPPEPGEPPRSSETPGGQKPLRLKNKGYGLYAFFSLQNGMFFRSYWNNSWITRESRYTLAEGWDIFWRNEQDRYPQFIYRHRQHFTDTNTNPFSQHLGTKRYVWEWAANMKEARRMLRNGETMKLLESNLLLGTFEEIQEIWDNSIVESSYSASSAQAPGYSGVTFSSHQSQVSLEPVGFHPYPPKEKKKYYPGPLITPEKEKPEVCDLSPVMSLQRQNNEMLKQNTEITNQAAAAIGVGAFPATYPGSLTTNAGTKKVNNLAEQVDTIYDTIDELMGKYPQKHKVKKKNKDGKDEDLDIEIPNQSEGQAELLGMMMQSLQQTSASNNMENRQLQELALTRQMVVKLYYMVESIMEYLDYPTETTVVNVPMSITPMKRKGRSIEKLKEFGEMVKESVQPVIVTKKKSGDPETLKKYLLHLSHGAAVIKAAFWRKLSPENPKEQINANLAQQEKLSELSSTEKAWNEALDSMASKLDPTNSEAKKNAPKIEVEKKKPGEK